MQRIHVKAPKNWTNDPNGLIWYKGQYHLFYQHFPFEPRWGTMHWGHAVSKDLVEWEHKDIALYPSKFDDQSGCYSGSAVERDGELYLFYTGVRYLQIDPEDIFHCLEDQFVASQMLVTSPDGENFDNQKDKRTVIPVIEDPKIGCRVHTRDPKVWKGKDAWYMLLGSRTEEGKPKLLFYKSPDLYQWTFQNDVTKENALGWMWECPDYFEVDGHQLLFISPMDMMTDGKQGGCQTICMPVEFQEASCTMRIPDTYQFMDYGMDIYAPQSALDEEGRRIVFTWVRMPEAVDGKWNGMFTLARVVEAKDGHIYFRPHPNIKKAFTRRIDKPSQAEEAGYRVQLELEDGEEVSIGGYRIFRRGNRICTDRSWVFGNHSDYRLEFWTPEVKEGWRLDVYVDPNLIEVYVNDGEYVISNVVYGLGDEIRTEKPGKLRLYTLEHGK